MFNLINGGTQLPTRGSKYSACVDFYAREDVTIVAGEAKLIPLGVCIDGELLDEMALEGAIYGDRENMFIDFFKKSHYLQLMLRSSLSKNLIIGNGVGVIDLDYRDEIMIRVVNPVKMSHNSGVPDRYLLHPVLIKKGQRVAQATLLEHKGYLMNIHSLEEREGGFGSTGEL